MISVDSCDHSGPQAKHLLHFARAINCRTVTGSNQCWYHALCEMSKSDSVREQCSFVNYLTKRLSDTNQKQKIKTIVFFVQ